MPAAAQSPIPAFPIDYASILGRIDSLDPVAYGRTRNYVDGAVSYLAPYISRGVISTRQVLERTLARGYSVNTIEKFVQELAWRDYWQQIWIAEGPEGIDQDLRRPQPGVRSDVAARAGMPRSLIDANTGVEAIDEALREFYETGYLHNHLRMYIAGLACTIGGCHWKAPARWMYYHLLDGDWASNALSWQWVSGANSGKQYLANQGNINRYCRSEQRGTFLDVGYEEFAAMGVPAELVEIAVPELPAPELPANETLALSAERPTCVYTYYSLDPQWRADEAANRVLLLEPSHFARYPVSQRCVDFAMALGRANIPGLQIYTGEFTDFLREHSPRTVYYQEHPLAEHFGGGPGEPLVELVQDERDWLSPVTGSFRSFFAFWKKCRKFL